LAAIFKALQQSLVPGADELKLMEEQNALLDTQQKARDAYSSGLTNILGQPIAQTFLSGQSADLQRQANDAQNVLSGQNESLTRQLSFLQGQRAAAADVARNEQAFESAQWAMQDAFNPPSLKLQPGETFNTYNPSTQSYSRAASGGAPLLQPAQVASLAEQLRQNDIASGNYQNANNLAYYQNLATNQLQGIQGDLYGNTYGSTSNLANNGAGGSSNVGLNGIPNYIQEGPYLNQSGGQARTDRSNNPTAMTTDVAKQAGLVLGRDYTVGSPFQSGGNTLYTANLIGDPVQKTIQVIDRLGFTTPSGAQRWSYINIPRAQWNGMSQNQKAAVVYQMYQKEGNGGALVAAFQPYGVGGAQVASADNSFRPTQQSQPANIPFTGILAQPGVVQTSPSGIPYLDSSAIPASTPDIQRNMAFQEAANRGLPYLDANKAATMNSLKIANDDADLFQSAARNLLGDWGGVGALGNDIGMGLGKLGININGVREKMQAFDTAKSALIGVAQGLAGSNSRAVKILANTLLNTPFDPNTSTKADADAFINTVKQQLSAAELELLGQNLASNSQNQSANGGFSPNVSPFARSAEAGSTGSTPNMSVDTLRKMYNY
jgi:hypothetical protein